MFVFRLVIWHCCHLPLFAPLFFVETIRESALVLLARLHLLLILPQIAHLALELKRNVVYNIVLFFRKEFCHEQARYPCRLSRAAVCL